jgi:hypothetical protein
MRRAMAIRRESHGGSHDLDKLAREEVIAEFRAASYLFLPKIPKAAMSLDFSPRLGRRGFPVVRRKFPVPPKYFLVRVSKFPVRLSRELRRKPEGRQGLLGCKSGLERPKSREFPVFSLMIREFDAESSLHQTASSSKQAQTRGALRGIR